MDTGVGVSAYSIIEQGQIDQLLHASNTDRRVIFEEAAGISKYKAHKKEALRKLDRTEQNLLRLADIVAEVQKQLRSAKMQAGKARNYLEYSERLKHLRMTYSLAEYDRIVKQTAERKAQLEEINDSFSAVVSEVSKNDATLSTVGKESLETEAAINACDNSLVAAKSKIEQQLERIEMLKSRIDELEERKVGAAEQIEKLGEQEKSLKRDIDQAKLDLEANESQYTSKNAELDEMQEIISEINLSSASIEAQLEDEKSGVIDIVRRTAQLHNEIESMGSYRERMSGQKQRLADKADQTRNTLEGLLTEKAQHQAKLDDIQGVLAELQESLDASRSQMTDIDAEQTRHNEHLAHAKENRSGIQSEIAVLADMEAKREGLSTSIKDILKTRTENNGDDGYIDGIVADLVSAEVEYAPAVEAALENRADALVINSTRRFLADEEVRQKLENRVNVICGDKVVPFVDSVNLSEYPAVKGRLAQFVTYDSRHADLVMQLLGHVLLVDWIDTAVELTGQIGGDYTYVTTDGQRYDGRNIITLGPVGKSDGLISRRSRLNQLEGELEKVTAEINEVKQLLEQNSQQYEHLAQRAKDYRTSIYEANTEKIDTESRLRMLEENIKRLKEEEPLIADEIESLEREISESVTKEHESREKLTELEEVNQQRQARIDELEQQYEAQKEQQEAQAAVLTELKVEIGQISEQRKSINQRISSLQSQLQHGRVALESARTDLLGCDDQVTQTRRNILASESRVSELYMEKEQAQKQSRLLHDKAAELRTRKQQLEELLSDKRTEQHELEGQIHQLELDLSQLSVKNETLTQRVAEELSVDLEEEYENFEELDLDWDEVSKEIKELRGKIERLGNVNIDSIDHQEELQQRFEFLTQQVEDLNTSKDELEQLINRINKESREKFRETFDHVRTNFKEIFRKLFGGGKADILLDDPDDILESGIEIVARPPGKETRTISLLSGGEKTMTAIALLFAVFRSKPSPFCILDEVDAALDEANNERFNLIVQEFREHSQFVIITHSKRTMSVADALFGVTMQTQGVSKKISVQFETVDQETAVA